MNQHKHELRRKLQELRQNIPAEETSLKNNTITNKLLGLIDWKSIERLHIYRPLGTKNEVDTLAIQSIVMEKWPHVEIISPLPDKNQTFPVEQFDLIIVPVLGFDRDKYRLGYGSGWYDRFLAGQKQARTIGLAYSFAQINGLPHEPHDIPLQQIVTEFEIF